MKDDELDHDDEAPYKIDWIRKSWVKDIHQIELQSFPEPWSKRELLNAIDQNEGLVIRKREVICGFAIFEHFDKGMNIHDFAVLQDCRRQGVGTILANELKSIMRKRNRKNITACIFKDDFIARSFMKSVDFHHGPIVKLDSNRSNDYYVFEFKNEQ